MSPLWIELAKGLPAALVALTVGMGAAVIAFHQYRVARAKLNLDLFEKRWQIYEVVRSRAAWPASHRRGDFTVAQRHEVVAKAKFLFGAEMAEFVNQVFATGSEVDDIQHRMDTQRSAPDFGDQWADRDEWGGKLTVLYGQLQSRFSPYMDFSAWKG